MKALFAIKEIRIDLILSIVITIIISLLLVNYNKTGSICSNYGTYVSLSSTLLGFLITAYAILITFPESYKIKLLKKSPLFPKIYDTFIYTIYVIIVFFLVSLAGFIFDVQDLIFCIIVLFFLIYSIICVIRTIRILRQLTNLYLTPKDDEPDDPVSS
jgi:hypothetical protein